MFSGTCTHERRLMFGHFSTHSAHERSGRAIKKRQIPAAAIYSGMTHREIDILLDNAAHGAYKFLYISSERLKTELFLERAKKMDISLLAIDEAHCISQWGYDFRPPYLEIAEFREKDFKLPV